MNTAEMWLEAQKTGKVYENTNGDMAYSSNMGLVDKMNFNYPWGLEAWEHKKQYGIDDLMECEWQEMQLDKFEEKDNAMTIEEAELKFGIKIVRD